MLTQEEKRGVMSTSRSRGAVGLKAAVPKFVRAHYKFPGFRYLDYGCGKDAIHVKDLAKRGMDVIGYDFWSNEEGFDEFIGDAKFEVVYASNVFNTHRSLSLAAMSIEEIKSVMAPGGVAILNLPKEPRYFWRSVATFEAFLRHHFSKIEKGYNNIYVCHGPLEGWKLI